MFMLFSAMANPVKQAPFSFLGSGNSLLETAFADRGVRLITTSNHQLLCRLLPGEAALKPSRHLPRGGDRSPPRPPSSTKYGASCYTTILGQAKPPPLDQVVKESR